MIYFQERKKKKNRRQSPRVPVPIAQKAKNVQYKIPSQKLPIKEMTSRERSIRNFSHRNKFHSETATRIPPIVPLAGSTPMHYNSRGSRPSTQEKRQSISRGSRILDEIPRSQPPMHVDFSTYKKLDAIRSQQKRLSLGTLSEDNYNIREQQNSDSKKFDKNKKSLEQHKKEELTSAGSLKAWSGRDVPMPLYMESEKSKTGKFKNRLYQSHNFGSLKPLKDLEIRPKTSPEILERRINSATTNSSMSERIHIRAPDDKLKELINILNTSRTNSRLSSSSSFQTPKITAVHRGLPLAKSGQSFGRTSIAVSLATLRKSSPPSIPSSAEESGSKKLFWNTIRTQNSESKRSTPESKRNQTHRPKSGQYKVITTPRGIAPITPQKKKLRPRCSHCSKKIGIATSHKCRCGRVFCPQHRYSESHNCSYDYKTAGKKILEFTNPLVVPPKLPRI